MAQQEGKPEFSRRIDVETIGAARHVERVEATAPERAALARRFGLAGLHSLTGKLEVARRPGGIIRVDGALEAEVEQTCVVTLEPFVARVADRFSLFYAEAGEGRDRGLLDVDMLEDEAWPEEIDRGAIDLGEAVAQQLSLALDPHPRAPGAELETTAAGAEDDNPFRALAGRLSRTRSRSQKD